MKKSYRLSFLEFKNCEEIIRSFRFRDREYDLDRSFADACNAILNNLDNYNFSFEKRTSTKIIFIVGLPQAGKSSLERMLSTDTQFKCYDEIYDLSEMFEELIGPDGITYKYPEYLNKLSEKIYPSMRSDFWRRLKIKGVDTDKVITNTMPVNFLYIPLLLKMLPNCKIIWCHRQFTNHLTCLYSKYFKHSYYNFTNDTNELLETYKIYYQVYNFYKSKIPDGFIDVQFEKLIYNPEIELQRVLNYINIDDIDTNQIINKNKDYLNLLKFEDYRLKYYLPYLPEFLD